MAPPDRATRPRIAWAVVTAAAVVATAWFTGAFVAGRYEARLGRMAREAVAQRARLARDTAALTDELAQYRRAADLLRDPATRVLTLRGPGPPPGATGRVLWHPTDGGQLFVAHLPPAPPGKAYELWALAGPAASPAGVFRVDDAGRGSHTIPPMARGSSVAAFAVTLEPAGGVAAPTGPRVLASR